MTSDGLRDAGLVALRLDVDDEVDRFVRDVREVREALVERVRRALRGILRVVGEQQLAAAVGVLGDDVELDRVDAGVSAA